MLSSSREGPSVNTTFLSLTRYKYCIHSHSDMHARQLACRQLTRVKTIVQMDGLRGKWGTVTRHVSKTRWMSIKLRMSQSMYELVWRLDTSCSRGCQPVNPLLLATDRQCSGAVTIRIFHCSKLRFCEQSWNRFHPVHSALPDLI